MAEAIIEHPPSGGSTEHNRRRILARLALAPVVAAVPIDHAFGGINEPHPAWWREATALREWLDAPEQEEIEDVGSTAPFARMCDLHDLIAETPARTAAGAAVQLAYVVYVISHSIPEPREFDAIASALAVLARLSGSAANG